MSRRMEQIPQFRAGQAMACMERRGIVMPKEMNGIYQVLYPGYSIDLYLLHKEHNAHEKKRANIEQVVSSVINLVHIEVNECHYFVNIKVSQPS
ncbi:hypothetical protein BTVI_105421 [Pitangus sulphuratus]|nr:hypothetical protein BTVI_105421 [Pitangus sulphuratus]